VSTKVRLEILPFYTKTQFEEKDYQNNNECVYINYYTKFYIK